jgi:hypothetical protein
VRSFGAFIRFREMPGTQHKLAHKLLELWKNAWESKDDEIAALSEAIRQCSGPKPGRRIGFHT